MNFTPSAADLKHFIVFSVCCYVLAGRVGSAVPAMLMRGSGHVAGAAAMAMAEAGKAIMPLVDKLANSFISDDPLLLADLRCEATSACSHKVFQGHAASPWSLVALKQRTAAPRNQVMCCSTVT